MSVIVVVAPHPDDETLGCGGTLLKLKAQNNELHWVIVTAMTSGGGFSADRIAERAAEIKRVADCYGFASTHELGFPCAQLDTFPVSTIVSAIGKVFGTLKPETVFLPFPGDVHTEHRIVHQAAFSCTKSFRYPSVRRVIAYETLSETDFGNVLDVGFRPNLFVSIDGFLDSKIGIMRIYASEVAPPPFPRSEEAIRSLALLRGTQAGCLSGEAFMMLKAIE